MGLHMKKQLWSNILLGVAFGYPECCIEYFNVRQVNGEMQKKSFLKAFKKDFFYGTGFIPCHNCRTKPKGELLKKIALNRRVPWEFPEEGEVDLRLITRIQYEEDAKVLFWTILPKVEIYKRLED